LAKDFLVAGMHLAERFDDFGKYLAAVGFVADD
jgi:hypothetical protein